MNREIERKFLVRLEPVIGVGWKNWRPSLSTDGIASIAIRQGYLSHKPSVRVRISDSSDGDLAAWITIKGPGMIDRAEYEYEIPVGDAEDILQLCEEKLVKHRWRVRVGEHVWDVDEFKGAHRGLWLAEVELSSVDEEFELPTWVEKEVSSDPRYTNGALARAACVPG